MNTSGFWYHDDRLVINEFYLTISVDSLFLPEPVRSVALTFSEKQNQIYFLVSEEFPTL